MQVVLEKVGLPEKRHVELGLQRSFDIQVSCEEVRKQVKRWLWVDVLVQTGEMLNVLAQKAAIEQCAEEMAKRLPAFQPYTDVPQSSIPTDLPLATQVQPIFE